MYSPGHQILTSWDAYGALPTTMEEFFRNMLLQYADRGAVLTTMFIEGNLVFPFELSGLPTGPIAGFLPKYPKRFSEQERKQYHNYISALAKQAHVLKDERSMELNWFRLRYLHSGEISWCRADQFHGITRQDDMSLPYVATRITGYLQRITEAKMDGGEGLDFWMERLTNHLKLVTDLMKGRYRPPPMQQMQLDLPPPPLSIAPCCSSSSDPQPTSNNISLPSTSSQTTSTDKSSSPPPTSDPLPEPEVGYDQKGEFSRIRDCKSPFCEYWCDPTLTDWDDIPVIRQKLSPDDTIRHLKSGLKLETFPRRQRFYGPWQKGGQKKPWMMDAETLFTKTTEPQKHISPGGYHYNKKWYNHKTQYFVETECWRIDVSVITTYAMEFIRDMCRKYSEWDMNRTIRNYHLYKTNHPMVFVFIIVLDCDTIHRGLIIFQGRSPGYVPYVVFKTPDGPFKINKVTPMMEHAKYDPQRPFHEYFTEFYSMVEKYQQHVQFQPVKQFVPAKETVKEVLTKFKRDLYAYWTHGDSVDDQPPAKRVCNGISGVALEKNQDGQGPCSSAASASTTENGDIICIDQPSTSSAIPQQQFRTPRQPQPSQPAPSRKNAVCYPQQQPMPPRKKAVFYPAHPLPPPAAAILPPAPPQPMFRSSFPQSFDQSRDCYPLSVAIPEHGPPSPRPLIGNSPPTHAASLLETEPQSSSTASFPVLSLDEQFGPPLTPSSYILPGYIQKRLPNGKSFSWALNCLLADTRSTNKPT